MLFRYGRDYYINDARRASGTRKKGSITPEIPASPSAAPRKEVSVEQLLETGGKSEESVPNNKDNNSNNDNYIMDKFLKESESQKTNKKRVGNSGASVLQRSVSLRSLGGNSHVSSPGTLYGSHKSSSSTRRLHMSSGRLDDDDNFSVLSLDRKMRDQKRRESQHHAIEVQLSDNVLAQFEAKSLHADLKRDSFRARNGTTNFALNPIYDETVFVPPADTAAVKVPTPSTTNSTVNYMLAEGKKESQKLRSNGEEIINNNIISSSLATNGNDTESTKSYFKRSSFDHHHHEEGRNNCIETSFETLSSLMRSRSTKLEAKNFGDDLY